LLMLLPKGSFIGFYDHEGTPLFRCTHNGKSFDQFKYGKVGRLPHCYIVTFLTRCLHGQDSLLI
jgi:hypothetical protein